MVLLLARKLLNGGRGPRNQLGKAAHGFETCHHNRAFSGFVYNCLFYHSSGIFSFRDLQVSSMRRTDLALYKPSTASTEDARSAEGLNIS